MSKKKTIKQKKKESRLKSSAKKFNKELTKNLHTAIIAAFSFVMALAWRDAITEYTSAITSVSPLRGKVISALIVTIIAVLGIVLFSSLFTQQEE